ncbi:hypothetical protein [Zoogloea sp.]|uniref:hypothetical protein n=1 Tax=Zoogloea sp. TaxID=49181 RepID=UPI001415EAE5|nr:MAG: hypothetical protein F9K15_24375 [Zoogloea sp.]
MTRTNNEFMHTPYVFVALTLFVSLSLTSCTTYTMTSEELHDQIKQSIPVEGTYSFSTGGLFVFSKVMTNGIRELIVKDKNGNEKRLRVGQRTQIRIHKKDGDYTTFYFDTLFIYDNAIVGQYTHFISSPIKPIPFGDVTKIEVQ